MVPPLLLRFVVSLKATAISNYKQYLYRTVPINNGILVDYRVLLVAVSYTQHFPVRIIRTYSVLAVYDNTTIRK